MDWISVDERLPDPAKGECYPNTVIVWVEYIDGHWGDWKEGAYLPKIDEDRIAGVKIDPVPAHWDVEVDTLPARVTHWMPVKGPKEPTS